jgi:hypothetical protein
VVDRNPFYASDEYFTSAFGSANGALKEERDLSEPSVVSKPFIAPAAAPRID